MAGAFPGIFYAPQWWQTADGCMPHRTLWAWLHMLRLTEARERLVLTQALLRLRADGDQVSRAVDEDLDRMHGA